MTRTFAAEEPGQAAVHQILIRVDTETGRFEYVDPEEPSRSMETVYVRPGDRVEWISEQGPWAVHPLPLSPLDVRRVQGPEGELMGAGVRDALPYGKYPYLVAVYIDGRVWTDDPKFESGPD